MPAGRPPNVTVAMPVYNGEPHLADAISSVLAQSYVDFELLICDDASSDRSSTIAASFQDGRIRLLRNGRNLGFGGNWNRCLSEARGRYVKILPQDDLLHPDCLMKQVAALDRDAAEAIALVYCARTIIGPSGRAHLTRGGGGRRPLSTAAEMARRTARSGTNPIGEPGAVLFRHAAAKAAGPFDGTRPFVIDIDYWLRLLAFGDALHMPEALSSFRLSDGSHSVRMARLQAGEFRAFLGELGAGGRYGLGPWELRRGAFAAVLNGFGRALFYRLALKER